MVSHGCSTWKLSYGSLVAHNLQVLTGFDLLTNGECAISLKPDSSLPRSVVLAEGGGISIAYEMCDGYGHTGAMLVDERWPQLSARCDYIFKRSFSDAMNQGLPWREKLRPLGPNYFCYDRRVEALAYPNLGKRLFRRAWKFDALWNKFEARGGGLRCFSSHGCGTQTRPRLRMRKSRSNVGQ